MSAHTVLDSSLTTMNFQTRAERKRLEREADKKNKVVQMTKADLEARDMRIYKEIREEANKQVEEIKGTMLKTAISCIESSLCIVLSDELGFGKIRIQRIIDSLERQLDCIISGNVTLEELEAEKDRLMKENKHPVEHIPEEVREIMKGDK